jgi:hypothetical protein
VRSITLPKFSGFSLSDAGRGIASWASRSRIDIAVVMVLAIGAAIASFVGSGLLTKGLLALDATDVWFDSDLSRVFDNMVSRASDYKRTDVHPFFAPIGFFSTAIVQTLTGLDDWTSVRVVLALVAATSAALLYCILRTIGLKHLVSVLFTVLAAVSASSMFWYIVPETMPFGGATVLAGVLFAAIAVRRTRAIHIGWAIAVNLLTLSVTVTNWFVALLATVANYKRQQVILIVACTVLIAVVLSAAQISFFPRVMPFGVSSRIINEEPHFMFSEEAGTVFSSIKALVFHGMTMPDFTSHPHFWHWSDWTVMRAQHSQIPLGDPVGLASTILWLALLGLGAWSIVTSKDLLKFRLVLMAAIAGQVILHCAFGREAFLYTPHFTPLLIILAAFGAMSRWRFVSISLAAVLTITAAMNNLAALNSVVEHTNKAEPAAAASLGDVTDISSLYARRVLNETPAAIDLADASGAAIGTVSPGGSLSIREAGVTIGFWSITDQGVIMTSDAFWSPNTHQRLSWPWEGSPRIDTNNAYFHSIAQYAGDGGWTVDLSQNDNRIRRVAIMIRTEAQSETASRRISMSDDGVLIDDRWQVRISPFAGALRLGEEPSRGRFERRDGTSVVAANGAAFALLELDHSDQSWTITITDLQHTRTGGTTK